MMAKTNKLTRGGVRADRIASLTAALLAGTALTAPALAQETEETTTPAAAGPEVIVITADPLNALPIRNTGSVFGFDQTLTEVPRSASSISKEQIERFGINDIYGLVAQSPGTFTNSFFGVGGALDIRGTPGEVYFRGVRRLDNPGNYATPIGASDRIDIVRGPASPIYGPSKTGGYMNFVPKSARLAGGQLLDAPTGEVSYTGGSWDKSVLSANLTGPIALGGREFGYNIYAELEDSGSYYRNIYTNQTILQGSFDTYLSDDLRLEFGGMYHDFDSPQNGGWNRLTQDLVDSGTYITGTAQPIDADGDGQLSPFEFFVGTFNPEPDFCAPGGFGPTAYTDACFNTLAPELALVNPGTTILDRSMVLTGPDDVVKNESTVLYFDAIYENDSGFSIKNQLFYEGYENINTNAYGFSQFHDSFVIEDKVVVAQTFEFDAATIDAQVSPSIRYTDFEHGDDYFFEYFHRVDLTQGYDARSDRLLSLESNSNFAEYYVGNYTDYGIAALVNADFEFGLTVLLGARYDLIDAESTTPGGRTIFGAATDESASDDDEGVSWNASVSYEFPFGVIPYVTASEQTTVIAGQGAEIAVGNILAGTFLSTSELSEVGVKGNFLDDRLFAAISAYEQERTDYNAQSITVNQAVKTEGMEAEFRFAVTEKLLITGAYTNTKVVNLTALNDGVNFQFFGIEDMINVSDPTLSLGGQPFGVAAIPDEDAARRAGIPENIYSLTGTYEFDNGFALSGSVVDVEEVFSGQSQAVELPAYTLVDLSASYEIESWMFRAVVKNATDEEYFRANFPELFGSTIVLPEKPRSFMATVSYRF